MTLTKETVEAALKAWVDPYLGCDLVSARMVRSIRIEGKTLEVNIALEGPCHGASLACSDYFFLGSFVPIIAAKVKVNDYFRNAPRFRGHVFFNGSFGGFKSYSMILTVDAHYGHDTRSQRGSNKICWRECFCSTMII